MLPPNPDVLLCRQGFPDTQADIVGGTQLLGFFNVGWYDTSVDDERGSFCVVSGFGPLLPYVGDFLRVQVGNRSASVLCIGSQATLTADIALTRRTYSGLQLLAVEPTRGRVSLITP